MSLPDMQQYNAATKIRVTLYATAGTVVTAITPTVTIRKNGTTSYVSLSGTVSVSDANGVSEIVPDATDSNTAGAYTLKVVATGAVTATYTGRIVVHNPLALVSVGTGAGEINPTGGNVKAVDGSGNAIAPASATTAIASSLSGIATDALSASTNALTAAAHGTTLVGRVPSLVLTDAAFTTYEPATATALATAQVTLTRLNGMLVLDGVVYQFTENALENGASGSGGTIRNVTDTDRTIYDTGN